MNRQQMVKAGRCRDCGVGGGQTHADECGWIGGVCEYQLVPASVPAVEPDGERLRRIEDAARKLLVMLDKPNVGNPHFEIKLLRTALEVP